MKKQEQPKHMENVINHSRLNWLRWSKFWLSQNDQDIDLQKFRHIGITRMIDSA